MKRIGLEALKAAAIKEKPGVEADIKAPAAKGVGVIDTTVPKEYFTTFWKLPHSVLICIYQSEVSPTDEWKRLSNLWTMETWAAYVATKLPAGHGIELEKCKGIDVPYAWIRDRVVSGWHEGYANSVTSFLPLIQRAGQCEFVPTKVGGASCATLYRIRYESVPHLPISPRQGILVNALYRVGRAGISVYECPKQLKLAFTDKEVGFPGSTYPVTPLKDALAFCPDIAGPTSLALVLGPENMNDLGLACSGFDPEVAFTIAPMRGQTSIFSNDVGAWASLFSCLGYDEVGRVSSARALACLPVKGFIGDVDKVPHWRDTNTVFKTRHKETTIVNHTFIESSDYKSWPANAAMYNPTPAMLKQYIAINGVAPKALVMPVTAVISNTPQVEIYGQSVNFMNVFVKFADTPIMIFSGEDEATDHNFPGDWANKLVKKLERAFIYGFLLAYKKVMLQEKHPTGFRVVKVAGSTFKVLKVDVELDKAFNKHALMDYMSIDDRTIDSIIPAYSVGEFYIGGKKIAAPAAAEHLSDYNRYPMGGKLTSWVYPGCTWSTKTGMQVADFLPDIRDLREAFNKPMNPVPMPGRKGGDREAAAPEPAAKKAEDPKPKAAGKKGKKPATKPKPVPKKAEEKKEEKKKEAAPAKEEYKPPEDKEEGEVHSETDEDSGIIEEEEDVDMEPVADMGGMRARHGDEWIDIETHDVMVRDKGGPLREDDKV